MVLLTLLICVAGVALAILAANRLTPINFNRIHARPTELTDKADARLTAVTWNIGYGSLGAGADFFVDGGANVRALQRATIADAAQAIAQELAASEADTLLLQEVATPSFLTRGIDIRRTLYDRLSTHTAHFWADFRTVLIPRPLRVEHGMASLTRLKAEAPWVLPMPQDPKFHFGFLKKYYAALVTRYPIADSDRAWVVINMHLSAFDPGAATRERQIEALFAFARDTYAAGDYVVIGGDWNMRLADTEFPHQTDPKHLHWIHDMPDASLPDGWQWGVDPDTPTVRTMNQPYVAGENFTMVIDGFAVSPNVQIESIHTRDLGFEHTDHHPVYGIFVASPQT